LARIGIGITTFERFKRFKESFEHLIKNMRDVDEIVIVDDCSTKDRDKYDAYFKSIILKNIQVVVNEKNLGVGPSKNKILKYFYDKGFDYIFTMEDDINIINPDVFNAYIDLCKHTGYDYINFSQHGPLNKVTPRVLKIHGRDVPFYPHIIGAFTLHTRRLIETLGYYDEKYHNAWEHVDYCYMASKKDLTSPFWMFMDVMNPGEYLEEQVGAIDDSSIACKPEWATNLSGGAIYFEEKHGVSIGAIPPP
jgi:GT2 family glycosyltransferase